MLANGILNPTYTSSAPNGDLYVRVSRNDRDNLSKYDPHCFLI